MVFTHKETRVMKAIACFLLIIHHAIAWDGNSYIFAGYDIVHHAISVTKVCVALFTFLSAYGLVKSFQSKNIGNLKEGISYMKVHVIKVYLIFWTTFSIFLLIVQVNGNNLQQIFEKPFAYNFLLNFMGLSQFTRTPSLSNPWWYISGILLYYACFPFLYVVLKKLGKYNNIIYLLLPGILFLIASKNPITVYFVIFIQAMALGISGFFDKVYRVMNLSKKNKIIGALSIIVLTVIFLFFRQKFLDNLIMFYVLDGYFSTLLILLFGSIFSKGFVGKALSFLGDYSFEMFLIHGLFLKYITTWTFGYLNSFVVVSKVYILSLLSAIAIKVITGLLKLEDIKSFLKRTKRDSVVIGIVLVVAVFLLVPKGVANVGARDLVVENKEMTMKADQYKVITFENKGFLHSIARILYTSSKPKVAFGLNGVVFAKEKGEAVIDVILPFGKVEKINVKVE